MLKPENPVRISSPPWIPRLRAGTAGSGPQPASATRGMVFSPDDRLVAWFGKNSIVQLLNLESQKLLRLDKGGDVIYKICFSPDQAMLAVALDNELLLWRFAPEIMQGKPARLLEQAEKEVGLKVQGMSLYPWNPRTGAVSENPLQESY